MDVSQVSMLNQTGEKIILEKYSIGKVQKKRKVRHSQNSAACYGFTEQAMKPEIPENNLIRRIIVQISSATIYVVQK